MKQSFTLIELIVVIAIIAILAAIIAPNAFRAIEKAKIAKTTSDLKTLKTAVLTYRIDTGVWPCFSTAPGWSCDGNHITNSSHCLLTKPVDVNGWDGPYLEGIPRSSLAVGYVIPGCGYPGYYYFAWESCPGCIGCTNYSYFDFDSNGNCKVDFDTCDTHCGVSVAVYGFPSERITLAVDAVFDGVGLNDYKGIMNTLYPACGVNIGSVSLYIGEPQP